MGYVNGAAGRQSSYIDHITSFEMAHNTHHRQAEAVAIQSIWITTLPFMMAGNTRHWMAEAVAIQLYD